MSTANMQRVEQLVATLPEAERVDIAAWDDHPSFRVRNKNFVFVNKAGTSFGLKLSKEEAIAVVASDPNVSPMGYGLGRHGWISFETSADVDDEQWAEIEEWVLTSYTIVAPKKLARQVLDQFGADD